MNSHLTSVNQSSKGGKICKDDLQEQIEQVLFSSTDWINIQSVVRTTFSLFYDFLKAQNLQQSEES
jgi:hypothetical protein